MGNVLEQIQKKWPTLTKTQLKIGTYIILSGSEVALDSLEDTANRIGVSKPSIIQFAKELGYSGYADLQRQLRMNMKEEHIYESGFDARSFPSISDPLLLHSFNNDFINLRNTMQSLSGPAVEKAVELLENAEHILALGLRESFALAHYFYSRMVIIQKHVYLANLVDSGMYEQYYSFGERDVCICYLFHQYTPVVFDILPLLKERGVRIIIITSPPTDKVESYADVLIPCQVNGLHIKNSTVAPMAVTNYLTNKVISNNYAAHLEYYTDAVGKIGQHNRLLQLMLQDDETKDP